MLKAVLFDMDGLIMDTESITATMYNKAAAEKGFSVPYDLMAGCCGMGVENTCEKFKEHFGPDFDFYGLRERRLELQDAYLAEHGTPYKPGFFEMMEMLERYGIPKALATSTPVEKARLYLGETIERFAAVVAGDMVKNCKPAPDIFLKAAQMLEISPEKCLVLEDSRSGIAAAHAAGMMSIVIPDLLPPTPTTRRYALRECATLLEAARWIEKNLIAPA